MKKLSIEERAKVARREYYRAYRKKHPEKVREQNRRYWLKRAERLAAAEREEAEHESDQDN